MPHKYRYEKQEDGKLIRIQESSSEPEEPHAVLNEFTGLCRQEHALMKDLKDTRGRIAALQPIVDELLLEAATDSEEAQEDKKKASKLDKEDLAALDRIRGKFRP